MAKSVLEISVSNGIRKQDRPIFTAVVFDTIALPIGLPAHHYLDSGSTGGSIAKLFSKIRQHRIYPP